MSLPASSRPFRALWLAAALYLTAVPASAVPADGEARLPEQVDEASGLSYSSGEAWLWTHNDNINDPGSMRRVTPFVYAISADGTERLRVELVGMTQRDWEAIDNTRLDGEDMLVIADSGDNRDSWPDYVLWFVPEPQPAGELAEIKAAPTAALRFRYPDGPADTEAMVIDAAGRQALLLTKRESPPRMFALPLADRELFDARSGKSDRRRLQKLPVHEAQPLGALGGLVPTDPINWLLSSFTGGEANLPTGMALSRDGRLLAVLTYSSLYFYRRNPGDSWAEAIRQPVATRSLPHIDQWEGLALSADGRYVSIVREGIGDGTLIHLKTPGGTQASPGSRPDATRGQD
ncbi:MAG: hypothetical protein JXJ30_04805 [Halothiobacillaceae bacterium]|nr:hypothetical protein [Halothiobacillaceae bacterium]HER34032.1 hypothetical protein [Halothiobacillaceae bacterium]